MSIIDLFAPKHIVHRFLRWTALRLMRRWALRDDKGCTVTSLWITTLGSGFWASRVLMAAVELRLFTVLADAPSTAEELTATLALHPRGARDFFDALVALRLIERRHGRYSNTPDGAAFLVEHSELYVGAALRMGDERLYSFWSRLPEALITGQPQNELRLGQGDQFTAIYAEPARARRFAEAMTAVSIGPAIRLANTFPWHRYRTMADIGAAAGIVPAVIAARHSHLRAWGVDLPALEQVFKETVKRHGVESRLTFVGADLFGDRWPAADVYVLGHMLHNFDVERRRFMVSHAFARLPAGGALIVYDAMIDDDRRDNAVALLMSLNMLIETPAGSDYTIREARTLLQEAGFVNVTASPLSGFDFVVTGEKPAFPSI